MDTTVATSAHRSNFVTVLAWIFIVSASFGVFSSVLQNVMFHVAFPVEEFQAALDRAPPDTPWFAKFIFRNFFALVAALVAFWCFVLVAAIALLKRKNWARITFIVLLALSIGLGLFGLVYMIPMVNDMSDFPAHAPPDTREQWERMNLVFSIGIGAMSVAISGVFAWLIWKLRSAGVVAEFRAGQPR